MNSDYAHAFAAAVAREINAELGRQDIRSIRAFARLLGTKNHTSWTNKLSPQLAKFVPMTTLDLALVARVLRVEPAEIMRRAQAAADWVAITEPERVRAEQVAERVREIESRDEAPSTAETA